MNPTHPPQRKVKEMAGRRGRLQDSPRRAPSLVRRSSSSGNNNNNNENNMTTGAQPANASLQTSSSSSTHTSCKCLLLARLLMTLMPPRCSPSNVLDSSLHLRLPSLPIRRPPILLWIAICSPCTLRWFPRGTLTRTFPTATVTCPSNPTKTSSSPP